MYTGRAGRPRKVIGMEYLQGATSSRHQMSNSVIARTIGVHRNTVRARKKEAGIPDRYTDISDSNLDHLIRTFKARRPSSGIRYAVGFVRTQGVTVPRRRVIAAMRRVDGLGIRENPR
jgi:hypothetical protein